MDAGGDASILRRRFIDDIFAAGDTAAEGGVGIPSEGEYGMNYRCTSESPTSLIFIGVRLFVDERGEAHTVLHDRAVDYPIKVDRYPEASTVANPAQMGGVIMGPLVAAQRTCSRLDLLQDAIAGIFTHAHRRNYSRRLIHSTWTRFLFKYWDAASVTGKELRAWFNKVWKQIVQAEEHTLKPSITHQPPPSRPLPVLPLVGPRHRAQGDDGFEDLLQLLTPEDASPRPPSSTDAEYAIFMQGLQQGEADSRRASANKDHNIPTSSPIPPHLPTSPRNTYMGDDPRWAHAERGYAGQGSSGDADMITPLASPGRPHESSLQSPIPSKGTLRPPQGDDPRWAHAERGYAGRRPGGDAEMITPLDSPGWPPENSPQSPIQSKGTTRQLQGDDPRWAHAERGYAGQRPSEDAEMITPLDSPGRPKESFPQNAVTSKGTTRSLLGDDLRGAHKEQTVPGPLVPSQASPPSPSQATSPFTIQILGTGPTQSKEVYVERVVPIQIPHIIHVDRPVYVDRYIQVPVPIYIPMPMQGLGPTQSQLPWHVTQQHFIMHNQTLNMHACSPNPHHWEAPYGQQLVQCESQAEHVPGGPQPQWGQISPRRLLLTAPLQGDPMEEEDNQGHQLVKRPASEALSDAEDGEDS